MQLDSAAAPVLATAPLTRAQRTLLATAANEAYSMLPEFMHHGDKEQDAKAQQLHDELMTLLNYDR